MTLLDTKKLNKLWSKSTDLNNPNRERHMFDLALFLWSNRQFDEAVAVTAGLLEIMSKKVGSSLWIDVMHLQSMALHDSKRPDEAIECEVKALEYAETLEPASERAFMHWHLADCYRASEQPEFQEAEYLKAIDAFIESENKFFLGQAYIDLANLQYGARRYLEAKKNFQLSIPVLEQTMRTDRLTFVKYRLAGVERHVGNIHQALSHAEEALKLAKFAGDKIAERENLIEIALIQTELSNTDTALAMFESLIEDNDDQIKQRSAAKAIYYRAKILMKRGDFLESSIEFEKAIPLLKAVDQENLAINAHLALIHLSS